MKQQYLKLLAGLTVFDCAALAIYFSHARVRVSACHSALAGLPA